jgi:hypothetical protein
MGGPRADPKFVNGSHKVFTFHGTLDLGALQWSVNFLVSRQQILSAHVVEGRVGPQFVFADSKVPLDTIDLSTRGTKNKIAEAKRLASELVWRKFPIEGPWLRVFAIKLTEKKHIIGFVIHHFIADAISVRIAAAELLVAYSAFASGQVPQFADLPVQYADYVNAVNLWLRQGFARGHEDFWRLRLHDAPATVLPPDKPVRPDDQGYEVTYACRLTNKLVAAIRRFTKSNSIAMITLILVALTLSLSKHTGSNDIVVQTCVSGRTDRRLAGLVGAFFDTVALRFNVPKVGTLAAFLKSVRRVVLEGYAHQDFSYNLVKPFLSEMGASGISPFLNFLNHFDPNGATPSRVVKSLELLPSPRVLRYAKEVPNLNMTLVHDNTGLKLRIDYFDMQYEADTIQCFCRSLVRVLEQIVENPARPVSIIFTEKLRRRTSGCEVPRTEPGKSARSGLPLAAPVPLPNDQGPRRGQGNNTADKQRLR